jgi:hypothetical protein
VVAASSIVLTIGAGVAPSFADSAPATSGVSPTPQPTVTPPPPKPACFDTDGDGNVDTDGDGLCDNWETLGIDGDGDGVVDLKLYDDNRDGRISASEVPDPAVKDVYVELDYMKGLTPSVRAIDYVEDQFAAAPEPIKLHVVVNDQIPFATNTRFVDCKAVGCAAGTSGFFDTKATYFGARAERTSKNWAAIRVAKTYVFHYALWVNHFTYEDGSGGYSGAGETDGNDFLVALGDWGPTRGGTANQQAATFMHELGHNLGLHHGGGDDVNCKPNYLSIMSYLYQMQGMYVTSRPIDYSRSAFSLDEAALDETAGVPAAAGWTVAFGPGSVHTAPAGGPIDWNGNGVIDTTPVAADVNQIDAICTGGGTVLTGYDDWANLHFSFFDNTSTFAEGVRAPDVDPEATHAEVVASADAHGQGALVDQPQALPPATDARR